MLMDILRRLLGGHSNEDGYSTPEELRTVWDEYSDQWPDNNERYVCWKPASILPAPKWAVIRAAKHCYANWPDPTDWNIYSAFFMQFVDLALHLPDRNYEVLERFRIGGREYARDPLIAYRLSSSLAPTYTIDLSNQDIIRVRDRLRLSLKCDAVGMSDSEMEAILKALSDSAVEFASLVQEWRFYILSIGRDRYLQAGA